MLAAYALVASLIEEYTRVVAVVDDGIAHEHDTLFPTAASDILLRVAGWHGLYESHPIAALYILLPGSDMHPSDQIASRLYEQAVAVVAHPCRHAHANVWPLVACTLGIAMHHDNTVVEPYLTFCKLCLTEACACKNLVGDCPIVVYY